MILHEVEKGQIAIAESILVMADRIVVKDGSVREVTRIYLALPEGTKILYVEESLDIVHQFMSCS